MLMRSRPLGSYRQHSAGMSMVELMVGIAIGLIIVGGGLAMLANFTGENRRLLLETRLNQDLRAAMDVVTRDIRRAGHWQGAASGVWVSGGPAVPAQNAYRSFYQSACNASPIGTAASSPAAAASFVCYTVAGNSDNVVQANEYYGFHLRGGVLYAVVGGSAEQPVTDPGTVTVNSFVVTPNPQTASMSGFCRYTCTVNCPQVTVREFDILLQGTSANDASLQRQLRSSVRVRNDYYSGQCPTS
jgi:prepilin peptidase dependent protein B